MLFHFLQTNPFIRIVVSLIFGILIGATVQEPSVFTLFAAIVLGLGLIVCLRFRLSIYFGICANLFFVCLGMLLINRAQEKKPLLLDTYFVKAVVSEAPIVKKKTIAVHLEVKALKQNEKFVAQSFKTMAYLPKYFPCAAWEYGDTVLLQLKFSALKSATNPYVFQYDKFLERKHIRNTSRMVTNHFVKLPCKTFSIFRLANRAQRYCANRLGKYIPDAEARGFLQALTLGYKVNLSDDMREDFQNVGVVHVLAVSGLHVGILFLLINLLFQPLKRVAAGRFLLLFLALGLIWSFAFVSGLSASVFRAAIMFSILQLSLFSQRPLCMYNSLALAAFIMLVINPFYLYEVGFQLSFTAVFSIVALVKHEDSLVSKKFWLSKLKALLYVSLAAQIGVAPLSLYYFHQLPTYFLLGNLVVLNLAPYLLGGSLGVLVFSSIPFCGKYLGIGLSKFTAFCIFIVEKLANLPHPILLHYSLKAWQVYLCYVMLFCCVIYARRRVRLYFSLFLFSLGIFALGTAVRSFNEQRQELFVVHDVKGESCYSLIKGRSALVLADENLSESTYFYILFPLWEALGIAMNDVLQIRRKESSIKNFAIRKNHLLCKGKHIVFAKDDPKKKLKNVAVDILVLTATSDWKVLLHNYTPEMIILDSSFGKRKSQKLTEQLLALGYVVHSVSQKGAFVLD